MSIKVLRINLDNADCSLARLDKLRDAGDVVAAVLIGIDDVAMATLTTTLRLR